MGQKLLQNVEYKSAVHCPLAAAHWPLGTVYWTKRFPPRNAAGIFSSPSHPGIEPFTGGSIENEDAVSGNLHGITLIQHQGSLSEAS